MERPVMYFQKMMTVIGKQCDAPDLIDLLNELELNPRIRIPRGESDIHVNRPDLGLSLVFEAEDHVSAKTGRELPTDAPLLVAAFFYGPGHARFKAYAGPLIAALEFSDGQQQARRKLGASVAYDADFNTEYWDLGSDLRLFLDYGEDRESIMLIQLGLLQD